MSDDPEKTPPPDPTPTPPPDPSPAPTPAASWTDGFDATQQEYITNKGWGGVDDLLQSYQNSEKLIGADPSKVLTISEDPAKMDEVWNKLGRPEAADKYSLKLPEEMKDGLYDNMAGAAHKAGLTDAQFATMQETFAEAAGTLKNERQAKFDADFNTWSQQNPTDLQNVMALNQAVGTTPEDMTAAMNGDTSAFYGILAKAAARMGEMPSPKPGGDVETPGGFQMTAEQAQAKIDALQADEGWLKRFNSDDKNVRDGATAERRPYIKIVSAAKQEDQGSVSTLEAENAALRAKLRAANLA